MRTRRRLFFVVVAATTAFSLVAAAQRRPAPRPAAKKPPAQPLSPDDDADDAGAAPLAAREERGQPAARPTDAGVVEQRTLDGGARVFRFGEVEVEGRLKSPQIVYFLRRVRAEFAAGDLGHRSFLIELRETRGEPGF